MQTKTQSAIEVVCSTVVAFAISVCAGQLIYPIYGMTPSWGLNIELTLWFTVISIVRSYVTRRFFNWLHGASSRVSSLEGKMTLSHDLWIRMQTLEKERDAAITKLRQKAARTLWELENRK